MWKHSRWCFNVIVLPLWWHVVVTDVPFLSDLWKLVPLKSFIHLLSLASGSPHQRQLLPGPDGHETRGGRSDFQLLWWLRGPVHVHLHRIPEGGAGESQGVPGTVICVVEETRGISSGIQDKENPPITTERRFLVSVGSWKNVFAFYPLCNCFCGDVSLGQKVLYTVFVWLETVHTDED